MPTGENGTGPGGPVLQKSVDERPATAAPLFVVPDSPHETIYDPENPDAATAESDADAEAIELQQRALLVRVFGLMTIGLLISATVAFLAFRDAHTLQFVSEHPLNIQLLFALEIISVVALSRIVDKFDIAIAALTFVGYAALNGLSFAVFFLFIPATAIPTAFFVSALTFATMAYYGSRKREDLASAKSVFWMFMVGSGVAVAVNFVLGHSNAHYAASVVLLLVFCWLVSTHGGAIRDFGWDFDDDDAERDKAALIGALLLYLDLVTLYLSTTRPSVRKGR